MKVDCLPAWDLSSEYPNSQILEADLASVREAVSVLSAATAEIRPLMSKTSWSASERAQLLKTLINSFDMFSGASILIHNCSTYAECQTSTDMNNEEAHKLTSKVQQLKVDLKISIQPQLLFIVRAPEDVYQEFIKAPTSVDAKFEWDQVRRFEKDTLLSEQEESLLSSLRVSGFSSWSNLYEKLSGTIRVKIVRADVEVETVGLAQAQALSRQPDPLRRRAAWQGIQNAWSENQEAAAAILNSLAGWRLEINRRRSHTREFDFLEEALVGARIERRTLEAMMESVFNNSQPLRNSLKAMAKLHRWTDGDRNPANANVDQYKMEPWDLLAPAPVQAIKPLEFEEALELIRTAFASAAPEFGSFVTMMSDRNWIEARVLPTKAGGAHCTEFPKSKTPRVFQTYMGSQLDISTLAHELGHAYHCWVIRDLPPSQRRYPMTLAETASIFAEAVLSDEMKARAQSVEQKLSIAYSETQHAIALLLNVSSRYEFEKSFYQKRQTETLGAGDLSDLMDQAWTKWYGDSLTTNEKMFWATKLHFHIADVSFYNFPYIFGYLFSLNIYARRQELGDQFMTKYIEILRDTGRMTAEDLIQKHLGEDIRTTSFWQKSLDVVLAKVKEFDALTDEFLLSRNLGQRDVKAADERTWL